MSNITALPGVSVPTHEPNVALVRALRDLVVEAEAGRLQSFIGTGWMADGTRLSAWFDSHPNVYETLGSIAWLHAEYIQKNTRSDG
jgi:hypothetical protein